MDQPWYKDGLRFECTQCGDCCTGAPGYVWVNLAEIEALARKTGDSVAEFQRKYVRKIGIRQSLVERPGGDCVFFDGRSRKCTVYDARPRQCKTWPFWNSNLRTEAAWRQTCEVCPGCDHGQVVDLEKITQQAAVLRL